MVADPIPDVVYEPPKMTLRLELVVMLQDESVQRAEMISRDEDVMFSDGGEVIQVTLGATIGRELSSVANQVTDWYARASFSGVSGARPIILRMDELGENLLDPADARAIHPVTPTTFVGQEMGSCSVTTGCNWEVILVADRVMDWNRDTAVLTAQASVAQCNFSDTEWGMEMNDLLRHCTEEGKRRRAREQERERDASRSPRTGDSPGLDAGSAE